MAANITINGLPILNDLRDTALVTLYENQLIGGPGAFVVPADTRDGFTEAVRRKLILEIAGEMPLRVAGD